MGFHIKGKLLKVPHTLFQLYWFDYGLVYTKEGDPAIFRFGLDLRFQIILKDFVMLKMFSFMLLKIRSFLQLMLYLHVLKIQVLFLLRILFMVMINAKH